jgi:hypothetical protein
VVGYGHLAAVSERGTTEGSGMIATGLQMSEGGAAKVPESAAELRKRAAHIRWLMGELSDPPTLRSLEELAEELEARVAALEQH